MGDEEASLCLKSESNWAVFKSEFILLASTPISKLEVKI